MSVLKGIIPPMITPLKGNDELDREGTVRLVEHIINGGVHALFLLGTTGEAQSLTYRLRYEFVELVCRQVNGRVPVLVGITDTCIDESIRLAEHAKANGAVGVVAAAPYYFAPSQQELIEYYTALADALPLPLYLYNMPSHVKVFLEPSTVKVLAEHPNIVGLKDSSANMNYFETLMYTLGDRDDFALYVGPEELTGECVLMGADGGINGGANMFPSLYVEMYDAAERHDIDRVRELQRIIMQISTTFYTVGKYGSSYLKGVKCALSLMGICDDYLAYPYRKFRHEDTEVTMTAVISRSDAVVKKEFITKVYSKGLEAIDMNAGLEASFSFDDTNMANEKNPSESAELLAKGSASKPVQQEDPDRGTKVLHTYKGNAASQGNRPGGKKEASNSYVRINNPLKGKNASGATVSLWVKCDDTNVWGEIWSFFDDDQTRLFLTQNAYLGYNNGTVFFDCNNGASVTNAIERGTWKLVTVSVDQNGFGIYIDGVLKYNKQVNVAYAGSSYDEAMGKRLLDLINSSDNFYIGYGGFWGSGELSVDNLKIYSMALGGSEITKLYQEEKDSMDQAVADKAAAEKAAAEKAAAEKAAAEKAAAEKAAAEKAAAEKAAAEKVAADKAAAEKATADQAAANKVAVGKTYTVGKLKYKVTSMKNGENYVTVTGVKTKSITSATIKATVKINGTSFKVRQIGSSAFAKCKKLKSLTIGSNVAKIGKKAFYNCSKLQKVTIKSKLITSVGGSALKGVYKKAKLKVPSSKLKKYKKLFKNKGQKKTVKITK